METIIDRQLAYLSKVEQKETRTINGWPTQISIPKGVAEPKIDSYLLALAAAPYAVGDLLDTFAGSGLVGFWLLPRVASVHFVDISPSAAKFIARQTAGHPFRDKIIVEVADVFPGIQKTYDTVVANPPYTDHVAKSIIERICFDQSHLSLRKFMLRLPQILKVGGNAFVSWPDYGTNKLIESLSYEAQLNVEICARIHEPSRIPKLCSIGYNIYRLTK